MLDRVADFPAQLARTRRFTAGVPTHITESGDGVTARFLRDRGLYELEIATGRERLLADNVDAFDGPALLRGGELWTLTGGLRRRPTFGRVTRVRSDPTGRRLAYAVEGALFLHESGLDRPLGPAGEDFVWSPDGTRLLVTLLDDTEVPRRLPDGRVVPPRDESDRPFPGPGAADSTSEQAIRAAGPGSIREQASPSTELGSIGERVVRSTGPGLPDERAIPYTAPGEPLPRSTLAVVGLNGERVETPVGAYLVRAGWDGHGPFAVVLSRDQRTLRLLAIDPATGAATVGHEQVDEPWVHVVPGLPARRADGTVVAHVDRDDTRHLTVGGVPVTPAGLQVREVLSVGEEVLFTASATAAPGSSHLWCYQGELRAVADEPGTVRDGQFVHFGTPGRVTVVREGKRPFAVDCENETGRLRAYKKGLKRAALFLPAWHRAGVGLPVLLDPYGGPTRQRVTAVPDWRDRLSQWFAEQGFAVLVADGAGTPGGGPRDERRIHGDLYGAPLEDQILALHEAAAAYPDLDLGRVGIRGWSFGGSLALAAVLRRPDVFHCAVAGAQVTDQRLYHAESRERYLGDPAVFPSRYDAGDLASEAHRLTRPLLLMHGLADTNVLPVHTTRMADALRAAGRAFEVRYFPGIGHSAIGSSATAEILTTQLAFLRRHLRAARPSDIMG